MGDHGEPSTVQFNQSSRRAIVPLADGDFAGITLPASSKDLSSDTETVRLMSENSRSSNSVP